MAFSQLKQLVEEAERRNKTIAEIMLEQEHQTTGQDPTVIEDKMASQLVVMEEAVRAGRTRPRRSFGGLIGGEAARLAARPPSRLIGAVAMDAMANAMAVSEVNASMGRIVATPTAGAAGILPGVLVALLDHQLISRPQAVQGLLTAAALGLAIANSSSISGAAGGCQAEVGSATAMTAGAVPELLGGSPPKATEAGGLALTDSLGLVCDPVAGLVEVPCLYRNGLHAVAALAAAECALAGIHNVIPADEVVSAMRDIGNLMPPQLRETGLGGLADTPTGRQLRRDILGGSSHA